MKKVNIYKWLAYIGLSGGLLMVTGCPDDDDDKKPDKKVRVLTLTKLAKDKTHKLDSNKIQQLNASLDGEFLYLIASDPATLMSKKMANSSEAWDKALGDFSQIKTAAAHADIDLKAQTIIYATATKDGLLLNLSDNKGLVVLKESGAANTSQYPQGGVGNFNDGKHFSFLASEKFIYLVKEGAGPNNVLFRPYVAPPANDDPAALQWNATLKAKITAPPADLKSVSVLAHDHEGNLLLADEDGIKKLAKANIGVDAKALENDGKAAFAIADFKHDTKADNKLISAMSMVGKVLLVGFEKTGAKDGGLAFADISATPIEWKKIEPGTTVEYIRPSIDGKQAYITFKEKGFALFDGKDVVEPLKGKGVFLNADLSKNKAKTDDYKKAAEGFAGEAIPESVKEYAGAVQAEDGTWYFAIKGDKADDGGVFSLSTEEESVKPKDDDDDDDDGKGSDDAAKEVGPFDFDFYF